MWLLTCISGPHLAHHGLRTALTVLGIALGVAAIVATTSVTDAVFHSFQRSVEVTAGRAQLAITNGSAGVPEALVAETRQVWGVAAAAPLVEGFVPLEHADGDLLAVFGLDVLADEEHGAQLPRDAIEIDDDLVFVSQLDSVAVTRTFAAMHGLRVGSALNVLTPRGPKTLVVRGLIDSVGPASLFGGVVGLMDLPAAQRLLAREDRVDRIDVRLRTGTMRSEVTRALAALVDGRALVEDTAVHGARAETLLFSVRVMLSIAALVAVVVGFFLIYHTVAVSVLQRRREMALLNAIGVSRLGIYAWLTTEAAAFGVLAGLLGYGIGFGLARVSLSTFGTVVTAFARLPDPHIVPSFTMLLLAVGVGLLSTTAATLVPAWSVVSGQTARFLHLAAPAMPSRRVSHTVIASMLGWVGTLVLLRGAPTTLPYRPLVAFIFTLNSLVLASCGLLCPLGALLLGRAIGGAASRSRGLSLLLAGRSIGRNPAGPVAVLVAIVMGLGWTLADAALIESFRSSWLGWLDRSYQSDLVVSGGQATVSFLTSPSVSEEVLDTIRHLPGVREAQGVRIVDVEYEGRPTAIQALDRAAATLPVIDGSWEAIAETFWIGQGVAVSRQLAYLASLRVGDTLRLLTPVGERRLPVLGVFTDFRVGTMGSVTMSRDLYRTLWRDPLVNTIRVWAEPGTDLVPLRNAIQHEVGPTHGLHAVTAGEFRAAVADLTQSIFALHYTVVLIAFLVSVVGVTNFLLAAALDRRAEFRTLVATGVSARQLGIAIVGEGAILGLLGSLFGLAAGVVIARIIVLRSVPMVNGWRFDFCFPIPTALRLGIGAVALAAAAGLLPAYLATRRKTVVEEIDQ